MYHFVFDGWYWRWLLIASCAVVGAAVVAALALGLEATSVEEGPLETSQEILLLLTTIAYGWAAALQRQAGRMASVGASVLAIVFLLRELELPTTGPITAYINSDAFRWHEAFVVLAIAGSYLALRWRLIPTFIIYLRDRQAWPYVLVAVLLLAGDFLDGMSFRTPYLATFFEETVETVAYATFALTGLHVLRAARSAKAVSD